MKDIHLAEMFPERGTVAISGGRLEEDFIKAMAYAITEGKNLKLIPTSPSQISLAYNLDVPHTSGPPTYFFLQAEGERSGCFLESITSSVLSDRMMCKLAEQLWVFLTDNSSSVLVEAVPFFIENTVDELSLYGKVEERGKNHFGNILLILYPEDDDYFSLLHFIRDVPGVIDAGIYTTTPDKKIKLI